MIVEPSHTQIGAMMDFLKEYPFISIEQYYWGLSAPMIRIMTEDATKVMHLSEKQAKEYQKYKKTGRRSKRVYTDSKEDLDAFERELGI